MTRAIPWPTVVKSAWVMWLIAAIQPTRAVAYTSRQRRGTRANSRAATAMNP
jgi:hypothetical protein